MTPSSKVSPINLRWLCVTCAVQSVWTLHSFCGRDVWLVAPPASHDRPLSHATTSVPCYSVRPMLQPLSHAIASVPRYSLCPIASVPCYSLCPTL
ncbi:hypothetical protein RRG08_013525 [Elysia crispata]|uniref:Secreted protein n=1 Tax=Elysia crispata TaxID=231223 RepID=A0AAE0Y0P1_9GAST|nr:hypothetical protein RRG08_013525 [Elysia crispata]